MKRHRIFSILLLSLALFSACKKEEANPTKTYGKFQLLADVEHGKCVPGFGLCLTAATLDINSTGSSTGLIDEVITSGKINPADGSLHFTATIDKNQLSDEASRQLLVERKIVVKNSFEVDPELVRQAFADSGLNYDGQRFEIPAGTYDVVVKEEGDPNRPNFRIIIIIKIGPVTIEIIIE
ncbi:MAG: hypothetical protein KatS3mg030_284 [Saprospiraceae bacterium]|nr:MAG: hypothetical protein KatS3mg030_284 [Saprospiraceae bacterium]